MWMARALLAVFAIALATGAWGQAAPRGNPLLTSYSPTQGTQGTTVTLTFTGANFTPRQPKVLFTPSQGLNVSSISAVSATQIVAQVQIAATAGVGSYRVDLQDADHDMIAGTPFNVVAAVKQQPACPNGAFAATCEAPAPTIKEMSPLSGKQGTTVVLTLSGANFAANESLQLIPSTGLTIGHSNLLNANQVQTQITIAASAPLGPRAVTLLAGNYRTPAPNTFTVTPGLPNPQTAPMQILRLVPSQITAGAQNVDIAIEGKNFVPGIQATFSVGAGVPAAVFAAGPARYVNSTEIHVTVNALATALPGGRDITLETPEHQQVTGPRMLDVIAQAVTQGPPPALKITPITLQKFTMGKIVLDTPQWGDQYEGETQHDYGIPVLDDSVQFSWHEQNPGMADYYVLNIYLKDGVTLLASERINGISILAMGGNQTTLMKVPNYYDPDAAFLASALEPSKFKMAPAGFHYSSHSAPTPTVINGVMIYRPPAPSSSSPQLAEGDLQWEVVGYHTYNTSGVAPQAANPPTKSGSGQSTAPNYMVNSAACDYCKRTNADPTADDRYRSRSFGSLAARPARRSHGNVLPGKRFWQWAECAGHRFEWRRNQLLRRRSFRGGRQLRSHQLALRNQSRFDLRAGFQEIRSGRRASRATRIRQSVHRLGRRNRAEDYGGPQRLEHDQLEPG